MMRMGLYVCAMLLLNCTQVWAAGFQMLEPAPAPPLTARDLDHVKKSLSDYRGKVVLVNFWASWCPPCRQEMPSIERLRQRMANRPLVILGVDSGETLEEVNAFLLGMKLGFPILLDPESLNAHRWKVFALPTSFLLDAEGRIRYSLAGPTEWDTGETLTLIQKLLDELPPVIQ